MILFYAKFRFYSHLKSIWFVTHEFFSACLFPITSKTTVWSQSIRKSVIDFALNAILAQKTQQAAPTIINKSSNQPDFPLGFNPGNSSYKRSSSLRNNIDLASAIVAPDSAPEIIRSECFSRIHSRHKGDEWTLMSIQKTNTYQNAQKTHRFLNSKHRFSGKLAIS
jgi:hypothetical protein